MGTFYFFICRCTFLLLFIAVGHGVNRCKTTKDCKNPEVDGFCDQNFWACERCSGYCSGAPDSLPLCMKNCPKKYWMMFGRDRSTTTAVEELIQKKNSTQEKQEDSTEKTPNVTEQEQGQDSKHTKGSNRDAYIVVGVTCGIVAVVAIVAVAIWLSCRCRRPTGSILLKDDETPNEIKGPTAERETTYVGEQADVEPCHAFSICVPSGLKDTTKDENVFYSESPDGNLTEPVVEELNQNTAKSLPAKLQSTGSQNLGDVITSSFI